MLNAFLDYLELEKNYSVHTVKAYQIDIIIFSEFLKENHQQSDVKLTNYSQIRSWIVVLLELGLDNRSINRKISSLNSFFKFLQKTEDIKANPLSKHKALKVSKKVQIPFSEAEMKMVLDDMYFENTFQAQRDKLIIEIFYTTGIRRTELINLKLTDIDIHNKTLKVLGKRNKERIVPLLHNVVMTINNYLKLRNDLNNRVDSDYLFLTNKGKKVYETFVYRVINYYFSMASTKVKKSPHMLRHTFATHMLNQGANLNAVKELLGHTSLAATQIYTHNSIAELKKVYLKSHPRNKIKTN